MISVVIPHVPTELNRTGVNTDRLLKRCVKSLEYNELIVVVNDYQGFAKSVNQGLKLANGSYICIVNNDTYLVDGHLSHLCDPFGVSSPYILGPDENPDVSFRGSFFCFPRWVLEMVGPLDERFELGYWEDIQFKDRLDWAGIPTAVVKSVAVYHDSGTTIDPLPERDIVYKENQRKYEEWKTER